MNVLVVGSGAREHALAWKLRQSKLLTDLFIAPGNAGTSTIGKNLDVSAGDLEGICTSARDHQTDLVVVGPELPLSLGLVDRLAAEGIAAFGPTQAAACLESSKAYARRVMERCGVPHAPGASFTSYQAAREYVLGLPQLPVIKTDGLAGGKGAVVCQSKEEALHALSQMMEEKAFGEAGRTVIVESRLEGREVSAHAFSDGDTVRPLPLACDYKRVADGGSGANTGGMGAYSPPSWLDEATERFIHQSISESTVHALREEGVPFRGLIYPGLMVTSDGPKVLEFNVRFGDPETQVLLPRLKSDLLDILWAVANGNLDEVDIDWSADPCVGVVLASGGYPDEYQTGFPIVGLGSMEPDVLVFHGGTRMDEAGALVTAGGRVLTVVATAPTLPEARAKVYRNVQRLHFSRIHYRKDVAAPSEHARVE